MSAEINGQVSVIIPYYNEGELLLNAIGSVEEQTYQGDLEIIIVDDASTVAPPTIPEGRCSVQIVRSERNRHAAGARNLGIQHSRGEYVCFLDADDVYLPTRIREHVDFLEEHPNAILVGGKCYIHREDVWLQVPNLIETYFPLIANVSCILPEETATLIVNAYLFHTEAFTVRRSVLNRVGGFVECYRSIAEWDLQVRLAQVGAFGYLPSPANHYLCRPNSITSTLNPTKFESIALMLKTWREDIKELSSEQRDRLRREERDWLLLAAQVYLESKKQPKKALACSLEALTRSVSVWGMRSLLRMILHSAGLSLFRRASGCVVL